jgi:hypothetical protein
VIPARLKQTLQSVRDHRHEIAKILEAIRCFACCGQFRKFASLRGAELQRRMVISKAAADQKIIGRHNALVFAGAPN